MDLDLHVSVKGLIVSKEQPVFRDIREPISKRSEPMLKNRSGPELISNKRHQVVAQKPTDEREIGKNH